MNGTTFSGLINNAALLLAMGLLYDTLALKRKVTWPFFQQVVSGVVLGLAGIGLMMSPVRLDSGVIFDTRSVLLGVTGLFFGTVPTVAAIVITGAYRLYMGGAGAIMGVGVITTSGLVGLAWRKYRFQDRRISLAELYIFGFVIHVAMLLWTSALPEGVAGKTLANIAVPVMVIYPIGTALLGIMMVGRIERNRADEAMRESESRYRSLFENNHIAMMIVDPDSGRIVDVNPVASNYYGWPREVMQKMTVFDVNTLPRDEIIKAMKESRSRESNHFLFQHRRADGSVRDIELHSGPIPFMGKSLLYSIVSDITDRKRAEKERARMEIQIQQTQKLESLGVLAGGIAHDFNNILMAVLGHADLAMLELPAMSPARSNIAEIEKAARRAAELCRQMLAYSGRGNFVIETINLRSLIEEMIHLLRTSISKKAILNLNLEKNLPPIRGDATQIRQIIMNLVINASEAIGDLSGVITISSGAMDCSREYLTNTYIKEDLAKGLYVWIEVSDTGCGMDKETQARLFEPFFTTKFTGRGLGMAAVLGIIRSHKGAIRVYSELGKGTTFKAMFPAVEDAIFEEGKSAAAPDAWQSSGTILLVDDEETIRALGKKMLERLGFQTLVASDGQEAVDIYRSQGGEIDLVILDLTMPHMNGEETFRELRMTDPAVRVVMSSGYAESDIVARFAGKGVAGFIQKPYTFEILKNRLRSIMDSDQLTV